MIIDNSEDSPETYVEQEVLQSVPQPVKRGRPRTVTGPDAPIKTTKRITKTSEDYRDRRDRNNVAVRKSRQKSKQLQAGTEMRVKSLQAQNNSLQKKVDLLTKELHVLKSLFTNVGVRVPASLDP